MAIVNGYCTLAEMKAELGLSDTADDTQLEISIEAASREIDGYTGRRFWKDASDVTRYFSAAPDGVLYVPDLADITSIATDTTGDRTYAQAWTASDYDTLPVDGYSGGTSGWPAVALVTRTDKTLRFVTSERGVRIVGKFGWDAVPSDVKKACLIRAAALFKRKDSPFGVAGSSEFGVLRIRQDSDVVALLAPYVRLAAMIG